MNLFTNPQKVEHQIKNLERYREYLSSCETFHIFTIRDIQTLVENPYSLNNFFEKERKKIKVGVNKNENISQDEWVHYFCSNRCKEKWVSMLQKNRYKLGVS